MVGELQSRQIVALVKDGMSAEEVAKALDMDVALVKLVVARNSQDGDRDITDEDLANLRRHAVELALSADDLGVQARMTQWLIERDKPKKVENPVSPVLLINQALVAMNSSYKDLMKEYQEKPCQS